MMETQISTAEAAALDRILAYWSERWDWECPLLFGLQLEEFDEAVAAWNERRKFTDPNVALAVHGALREFLHGARAAHGPAIERTGLSRQALSNLAERLSSELVRLSVR